MADLGITTNPLVHSQVGGGTLLYDDSTQVVTNDFSSIPPEVFATLLDRWPQKAKFLTFMLRTAGRVVPIGDKVWRWREDDIPAMTFNLSAQAASTASKIQVPVNAYNRCVPGTFLRSANSSGVETLRVTSREEAGGSYYLNVLRDATALGTALTITTAMDVEIISTTRKEGDSFVEAWSNEPKWYHTTAQRFEAACELTDIEDAVKRYPGENASDKITRAMWELQWDIEKALLTNPAALVLDKDHYGMTPGVMSIIPTVNKAHYENLTRYRIVKWMENFVNYGNAEGMKLGFCTPNVKTAVGQVFETYDNWVSNELSKAFGFEIVKVPTEQGTLFLVDDHTLRNITLYIPGDTPTTAKGKVILAVDPDMVWLGRLQALQSIHIKPENSGQARNKHVMFCTMAAKWSNPYSYGQLSYDYDIEQGGES